MNFSLVNRMANLAIRNNTSCIRSSACTSRINFPSKALSASRASSSIALNGTSSDGLSTSISPSLSTSLWSLPKIQLLKQQAIQPTKSRDFSTAAAEAENSVSIPLSSMQEDGTVIATGPDGTQYSIPLKPLGNYNQKRHAPKIAPRIVNSRIKKLRTFDGKHKSIRHSPWRLNLVCQFAAGQTVNDALQQLEYVNKVKAPLVHGLIRTTANGAKMKYGLLPSQLEIVECFATHGTHLKRIKTMGRGRAGKMHRRFSHVRLVLREIDFPLKIMQCTSINQRKKWVKKMEIALQEEAEYMKEKEEIDALEREVAEMKKKKAEGSE